MENITFYSLALNLIIILRFIHLCAKCVILKTLKFDCPLVLKLYIPGDFIIFKRVLA